MLSEDFRSDSDIKVSHFSFLNYKVKAPFGCKIQWHYELKCQLLALGSAGCQHSLAAEVNVPKCVLEVEKAFKLYRGVSM